MLKKMIILLCFMVLTLSGAELQRDSFSVVFGPTLKPEDARTASLQKKLPSNGKKFLMPENFVYDLKNLNPNYVPINDGALVAFEIMAEKDEELVLGVEVDYWFTLFLNGEQIGTSEPGGGGETYDNGFFVRQYILKLKKGRNYCVMHTRPGTASWKIKLCNLSGAAAYGPYLFEVDRDSAVVALEYRLPLAVWLSYWEEGKEGEKKSCKNLSHGRIALKKQHRFELKDLKPDTRYHYQILPAGKTEQSGAPCGSFKTLPTSGTKHVMTAISDTQFPAKKVGILKKFIEYGVFKDADLLVSLGDVCFTFNKFNDKYFDTFLDIFRQGGVTAPFYPVRGNHEFRGKDTDRYSEWFGNPYYAFRYGEVLYIVLDCGDERPFMQDAPHTWRTDMDKYFAQQKAWLEDLVKSDLFQTAQVRIVLAHASPFRRYSGRWFAQNIEQFAGCLMGKDPAYQIDLWLCGHTHSPVRYDPVTGELWGAAGIKKPVVMSEEEIHRAPFPVYVNDGPGGRGMQCSVIRLEVEDRKLRLKCVGDDGTLMDSIVIERGKPIMVEETTYIRYNAGQAQ